MAVLGNDILIYLDGDPIGGVKSDDVQSEVDLIEVASNSSAQWKEYITGRKGWSFTSNYLVLSAQRVQALLSIGTVFTVLIKGRNTTANMGVAGKAILTDCKITATRGNLAQGSFSFTGSGPFEVGTVVSNNSI